MTLINRIPFRPAETAGFFTRLTQPLTGLPSAVPLPSYSRELFLTEAGRNEIVLYTDGETVRLTGIFPEASADAFFGFWETTNDANPNREAFALLEADARQRGRQRLIGPVNFNTFHAYRLRLTEPSWGAFDREPANPAYYPALLRQLGFQESSRFESRRIRKEDIPLAYRQKKDLLDALSLLPFRCIPLTPEAWQDYEDAIYTLVGEIFSANPVYRPVSREQFHWLYDQAFAEKLCPHSSVLFQDFSTGKLVAMSFCLPDYQTLPPGPGETPVFARDYARLSRKTLLVKSVGVHPAYRKQGLMSFLGAYGMVHFQEYYEEVIFCLMRSDNFSLQFSKSLPHETACYALFEKSVS
ncbi:hypothetical protein [Arsenicibacter rosenii]|uniref:N-acetyltransferase domain-containing protein n=1 Tax=Arsenicibacter rosenii TaxID=1750698 RepID=A0A1S2VD36_9BACT|nr:hypothetical protein [Arsenicibacter rosenii]OIN56624.1 hypothetical protein BLX24_23625 [Arsenicibacter rosenii]